MKERKLNWYQLIVKETVYTLIGVNFYQWMKRQNMPKTRSKLNIGVATMSTASTGEAMKKPSIPQMKMTVRNIVLVPYTPKPTDWGSWRIKSPYATSSIASPPIIPLKGQGKEEDIVYEPHTPYYSPVHPPEFYEDD